MSILTLTLTPEDERQLLERARLNGQSLDEAALSILREQLASSQVQPHQPKPDPHVSIMDGPAGPGQLDPIPPHLQSDFWPRDESVDTFLDWLKENRREGRDRVWDLDS
jgi:hypothetical protein